MPPWKVDTKYLQGKGLQATLKSGCTQSMVRASLGRRHSKVCSCPSFSDHYWICYGGPPSHSRQFIGITYNCTHPHHALQACWRDAVRSDPKKGRDRWLWKTVPFIISYKGNRGSKVGLQQFSQYSLGQRGKGGHQRKKYHGVLSPINDT